MKVQFSYLDSKFKGCMDPGHPIYESVKELMNTGDFTLGKAVRTFEEKVERMLNVKHAIGVANGTDALRIGLRLAGVGPGDEVITAANTFIASAGCADELFARPVFVDMADNHVLDPSKIEAAITPKTKAIVPVHFTGQPCDMGAIMEIANRHKIPVIEDACQSLMAEYKGKFCGTIGLAGAISLHPLKVLNGTGDGGLILTNDDAFAAKVRNYRNHGLINRDEVSNYGCNSRLDTIQACFLNYLIDFTEDWTFKRRINAYYYDKKLSDVPQVKVTRREKDVKSCYHLYFIEVEDPAIRDDLVRFLNRQDIEAKVHYPIPLQGALGLHRSSEFPRPEVRFPKAYEQSARIITLPVHEHITQEQQDYVVSKIKEYFSK